MSTEQHPLTVSRSRLAMSQAALARSVECGRSTINLIESGKRRPSMALLSKLVDATGVSADAILRWDGAARDTSDRQPEVAA